MIALALGKDVPSRQKILQKSAGCPVSILQPRSNLECKMLAVGTPRCWAIICGPEKTKESYLHSIMVGAQTAMQNHLISLVSYNLR